MDDREKLLKLQFQMEIIRTLCPVIAIVLQIIILVRIF